MGGKTFPILEFAPETAWNLYASPPDRMCPILRDKTLEVISGLPPLFPFHQHLTRGLPARWLFRAPPCREGTPYLQMPMPSAGFKPRPYDTALSVTNRCTR
ncbi:hypothetical protein TNCV_4487711 [Trichonephila clavipes]|nr:hypothetical protein TNCV_4487711 [Trichonephila clavipes]